MVVGSSCGKKKQCVCVHVHVFDALSSFKQQEYVALTSPTNLQVVVEEVEVLQAG